jgi:hypothetical protein
MHGCGKMRFPSGDHLSGIWRNGVLEQGSYFSAIRDCCFTGNYSQGLRSGFGSETFKDGSSYEGSYALGLLDGFGILSLADGTVYEGSFSEGNLHGQGSLHHPSLGSFIGEFSKSKPHGSGVRTYSSGDTFTGTFAGGFPVLGVFHRVSDGAELHISQLDQDSSSRPVVSQPHAHVDSKAYSRRARGLGTASPRRLIDRSFTTPSSSAIAAVPSTHVDTLLPETPIQTRGELGDVSFTFLATPTWV